MKWEDKVKMANLLNNGKYKEATDYYLAHETWTPWDDVQALDMYATGIDLTKADEITAFEGKLKELRVKYEERYNTLGFRARLRLEVLQNEFYKIHNGTSNFREQD